MQLLLAIATLASAAQPPLIVADGDRSGGYQRTADEQVIDPIAFW